MTLPISFLATVLLDVVPPDPSARASVDPTAGSQGFAATYIFGGFFALGLLLLIMLLFNRRPRSVRR